MSDRQTLEMIIARALAAADSEIIRDLMAESLTVRLENYDAKDIIAKAMNPFIAQTVKELLDDPAVKEVLTARIKQQFMALCGSAKVSFDRY